MSSRGFNLILVERDFNQLQDIEANLKRDSINEIKVTKIVLDKFDQDTLNKQLVKPLNEHQNSPVKLFINCKNSRLMQQSEAAQKEQHTQAMQDSTLGDSLIIDQSKLNESQRQVLS